MSSVQGSDQLLARLRAIGETQPELRVVQLATVRLGKIKVHKRSRFLQRNIVPGELTKDHAIVEARTPYAAAEELGRGEVTIRPKKAKVLAWGGVRRLSGSLAKGSKPTHFAREVHQPPRKGHPYLVPAAKEALKGFLDAVVTVWNRAA